MSRVLICGGNGQVSKLLIPLLKNHSVTALIRDSAQSPGLEALGASARVFSLESSSTEEMSKIVSDHDIVVWSAGAGGKGGVERTRAVDRDAAIRMISACRGHHRFIMVSALTSRRPDRPAAWWSEEDREVFGEGYRAIQAYHEAKVLADEALMASRLAWTIVRPGTLTNESATGRIRAGRIHLAEKTITRADVAAVLAAVIEDPSTVGLNIDVLNGDAPIAEEIARVGKARETSYELIG